MGLAVSVVRRPDQSETESEKRWSVETKGYGVRNEDGDPVTPDVSLNLAASRSGHMIRATLERLIRFHALLTIIPRLFSQSVPTQNSSHLSRSAN